MPNQYEGSTCLVPCKCNDTKSQGEICATGYRLCIFRLHNAPIGQNTRLIINIITTRNSSVITPPARMKSGTLYPAGPMISALT